jgi:hypothetical protein
VAATDDAAGDDDVGGGGAELEEARAGGAAADDDGARSADAESLGAEVNQRPNMVVCCFVCGARSGRGRPFSESSKAGRLCAV